MDDRWTSNRSVTDIDWSPKVSFPPSLNATAMKLKEPCIQFPELVAASYNKNLKALQDPDGVVAIWNMHLRERPEFVFHSQVSSSVFHFHALHFAKVILVV